MEQFELSNARPKLNSSKTFSKIASCLNHVSAIYIAVALVEGGASNSRLG